MIARRQPDIYGDPLEDLGGQRNLPQAEPDPIIGTNDGGSGEGPGGTSQGPRETQPTPTLRSVGEGQAAAPRPMEPTPIAGAAAPAVNTPMPGGPGLASLASPARRGLFGGAGGLTGGGLGVPGSGMTGDDPISALIQQLLQNRG